MSFVGKHDVLDVFPHQETHLKMELLQEETLTLGFNISLCRTCISAAVRTSSPVLPSRPSPSRSWAKKFPAPGFSLVSR